MLHMYLRSQYIVKNSWATSQTPLIDFIVSVLKQTTLIANRTWPRRDDPKIRAKPRFVSYRNNFLVGSASKKYLRPIATNLDLTVT